MEEGYRLLVQLQELEFAAIEIRLYLDTHQFDRKAQHDFSQITYQIMMLMPQVERFYGPLIQYGFSKENPARWVEEPWPWELIY